jgi:hypothetical protein
MEENGFSLEGRILCSDGACIGTIGQDGLCKVCGKAYQGGEGLSGLPPTDASRSLIEEEESKEPEPEEPDSEQDRGLDPNERICCPDETCIGVIGEDGRCGTCGKTL